MQQQVFDLILPDREAPLTITLNLLGEHNVENALAAAAVAWSMGASPAAVQAGLSRVLPVPGRLCCYVGQGGARVIDDTYNANPCAFEAAVRVLASYAGETVLVLGEMAELGPEAEQWHAAVGEYASQQGIDRLWAVGPLSKQAVAAFGERGAYFENHTALIAALLSALHADMTVLVKGARSMKMEQVVEAIAALENSHAQRALGEASTA